MFFKLWTRAPRMASTGLAASATSCATTDSQGAKLKFSSMNRNGRSERGFLSSIRCGDVTLSATEIERFRACLLLWFDAHKRDLPWRRTRDPFAIWLSEIMLQQTRVAAVIPYYERFLNRFPNFEELATAPEPELLAYWSGLGYYYRARNLQLAARRMRDAGMFPASYAEIRRLPGVGDYTAAAVASIGFNLPHAVLDGNVFRVLSRIFDDRTDIAGGHGRK